MERTKRTIAVICTLLLFFAGILWWWPLAAAGVLLAAILSPVAGVALGLMLDITWGAPQGALHVLYFPWTLFAVVVALVRYLSPRFFFSRGSDTLV